MWGGIFLKIILYFIFPLLLYLFSVSAELIAELSFFCTELWHELLSAANSGTLSAVIHSDLYAGVTSAVF